MHGELARPILAVEDFILFDNDTRDCSYLLVELEKVLN